MFDFCTCTNIKQIPGHKETDHDVQFTDNYLDNQVSVPALIQNTIHAASLLKVLNAGVWKH